MLQAYVHYLCEEYHANRNLFDIQELKLCIVLKTNKGMMTPSSNTIYLTRCYGNTLDLKGLLSCKCLTLFIYLFIFLFFYKHLILIRELIHMFI